MYIHQERKIKQTNFKLGLQISPKIGRDFSFVHGKCLKIGKKLNYIFVIVILNSILYNPAL